MLIIFYAGNSNLITQVLPTRYRFKVKSVPKKIGHFILLHTSILIAHRAILQKQWSKQFISRIKMRYCTSLQLNQLLRYGEAQECINFAIFAILYRKFVNSYKNSRIEKSTFLCFLVYLRKYLSYRDTQSLILIFETNYFDHFNCNLALGTMVLEI